LWLRQHRPAIGLRASYRLPRSDGQQETAERIAVIHSLVAALALATSAIPLTHEVAIEGGPVPLTLRYDADVTVEHRQHGTVAPGGRADTLRCHWTTRADVRRTLVGGAPGARTLALASTGALRPMKGHRPGWCEANRTAIAASVEAGLPALRAELVAFAERDRPHVSSEIHDAHALFRPGS
jgi:hypothetical protein